MYSILHVVVVQYMQRERRRPALHRVRRKAQTFLQYFWIAM